MSYRLWYWPDVPGRGEFVRLALEAGGIAYRDCAREPGGGLPADLMRTRRQRPFAPPYLIAGRQVIGQTSNILLFLGEAHPIAPKSSSGRHWVHQLQLTIMDAVLEAHDVHHPIDNGAYYEDQADAALLRAAAFRARRLPKLLDYFEDVLAQNGTWLGGGRRWSYADLSMFQLIAGLRFAFPRRMRTLAPRCRRLLGLHERISELPVLAAYFASERRLGFSDGLFRHYPELDAA